VQHAPSTPAFDAPKAALRVVRNFKMGAICPSEMWAQLADVLSRGDVHQVLDTLPPELQVELRDTYRDRPLPLLVLRGNPLRRQIESWCLGRAVRPKG